MGKIKKKGIFFTFIAITMMAVFILIFTPQANISLEKDNQAVRTRIRSVDNYVNDLQNGYFETALRAATYKTILSLVFYMNSTGSYVKDFDASFYEVMLNGTIVLPGTSRHVTIDSITGKKIMDNSTISNWTQKIVQTAQDTFNVNTTIVINNISIRQTKPWTVDSTLDINFTVNSSVASWSRGAVITTSMSIEGFYDPYYLVNTGGVYTNTIKASSVPYNQWNISVAREDLRNGTYVHWENSNAPNFLMRFSNITSSSGCCGIESLVNPNLLAEPDMNESYVDYQFFNRTYSGNCQPLFNITNPQTGGGLWDEFRYFKLDFEHVTRYNITADDAVKTCQ